MVGLENLDLAIVVRIHTSQPWFDAAAKGGLAHHNPEQASKMGASKDIRRISRCL
jgi:hypothetical protein